MQAVLALSRLALRLLVVASELLDVGRRALLEPWLERGAQNYPACSASLGPVILLAARDDAGLHEAQRRLPGHHRREARVDFAHLHVGRLRLLLLAHLT